MSKKEFKIGTLDRYGVYIDVELKETNKGIELSVCGHTQYRIDSDWNTGGQIDDYLRKNKRRIKFMNGWNMPKLNTLLNYWSRWHLNGLNAGCEHQRSKHWEQWPIDFSKPRHAYGKFFPGQKQDSWNLLGWITPKEHPQGLLTKPCPECGYKYGSAWLFEPLPVEVIEWFDSL